MSKKHRHHDHLPRAAGANAGTAAPKVEGDGLLLAGCVESADPETGKPDVLTFWLPKGVTVESLGLERVLLA
jgi:hypothetical protein